ncbi:MAG TPA: methyltransferase [Bryobacteraceae bacterium]|nr:methyltransferase [Bryobacteraceae bacterium]
MSPAPSHDVSPAYLRLVELLIGARVAQALRVVAEHHVADHLASGPKGAEQLSTETGLPAATLRRVLRGLAALGVFEESADGLFSNSEVSAYLRDGVSPSLREMVLVLNDDAVLNGWRQLPDVVESGAPAFPAVNGKTFFQHIAADTKRSQLMGKFMAGIYGPVGARIAEGYPFGRFRSLLDVGGAQGHVLVDILQRHPAVKGALFDLPRTAEVARQFLNSKGFGECEVFPGDFFEAVPSGYDAYFLKAVLHDWDDDKSVRILRTCREAMPEHGRLLVCEIVVEPGKPVGHPHRLIDLEMMVTFGGKERTASEFGRLLDEAGLQLEQITPIETSFVSIVEASRKP